MDYYRFFFSCAGFNINDGWFLIVGSVFKTDPKSIVVVAKKENSGCSVDKIEQLDSSSYKIFIKDIKRESVNQEFKVKLDIIYALEDGKLLKQTLKYDGKSDLNLPEEILIK